MQWTTEFNTAEQTMTHTFNDHVKMVASFKDNKVSLVRFGKPLASYILDTFSLPDYKEMLILIAKDAQALLELQEVQG